MYIELLLSPLIKNSLQTLMGNFVLMRSSLLESPGGSSPVFHSFPHRLEYFISPREVELIHQLVQALNTKAKELTSLI